jgi:nicotinamidase-related amidase
MKLEDTPYSTVQHQILLSPKQTALVIVDHQTAFEPCFEADAVKDAESAVAKLISAAEKIDIPVIVSLVETNLIGSTLSPKLEESMPQIARFNRTGVNPWDDPAFVDAIEGANRPRLLIAGLSVETSLSFTALCALERGFDVYVVKDASLGYSDQSISTTFDRLTQAGVVPVSWRQILMEWNDGNVDAGQLRRVMKSSKANRRKNPISQQQS